jgi:dihydrofolate reductase
MISLILARADNGVIGRDGGLPWRLAEDMRRFKALTLGKPCIMGRKTWDSLPRKPLPGRTNIVLSRGNFAAEGARVARSFAEAVELAENAPEIMVIGGAHIFAVALPQADRIYLTEIHAAPDGDVRFPAFPPEVWTAGSREDRRSEGDLSFSYVLLERRN